MIILEKFKSLSKKSVDEVEKETLENWKRTDILSKTIENRKDSEDYVFYDGPIYANAKPGIHHVFAKTIKDSFCKYKTMQGYRVLRKIGLDTHGLPIEVNVEKKLGFKSKSDIEAFGIENFCKECNKETASNIDEVKKITDMMGQFIDMDNPYVTCDNNYIESEWWIIKEMDKKGLLYHGNKVLWYCPRCETELSQNEVSQGYQEVSVNSIIIPFKKVDEDIYFLAWTTTAWTLIANVALCVNPDFTYVLVESMGYKLILAECLLNKVLGDDVKVLKKYKGTDLVGMKYEQLMPFVEVPGKAFEIIADNYVTDGDGTGIVHNAPAFGEDDNRVCRENGIGFVNPVGSNGCYVEGPWKGRLVTDPELEIDIIKWLKQNDKLFKKIKITHDYPHCWRCKSPLISYPKPAWYIKTTEYKDKIIKANQDICWHPDYVGTKRFSNWLENMIDWGVSRNRYWGCPMPIWTCECGHREVIGSLDELQEKIIENVDVRNIELHRPYVDELHIKCHKCGKIMNRVLDVMDVWFDSGSMPYAQFHYPFENKELFESQFPADFIAEGIDQTRGWFYVLLVISTIISGEACFKNVVVNDMMLDAYGKKMSKSTGNIIDPVAIMSKYGADNIRWYMLYVSPVWTPLKFSEDGVKEVYSKFFNPFKNTYSFFQTYANIDNIDINDCNISVDKRKDIDKWIISKYNKLVKYVTDSFEEYDLYKVVHAITDFVSEDLSNWYIRRNRDRFWSSELDDSKKSVYITTYEVLTGICKLAAPIAPYLSDEIYTKLTCENSVHLADFPKYDESLIDSVLEEKMDLARDLISTGRYVREEAKIRTRQVLSEMLIDGKNKDILGNLAQLIQEELNVKKVTFVDDVSTYMNFIVKPNFRLVGKIFGANLKEFQEKLLSLSIDDIKKLEGTEEITMNIAGNDYQVTSDMVDIRIEAKEGFNVAQNNNNFVILNTTLTKELIDEGIAREIVSKVQLMRKNKDLELTDRITIYYKASDTVKDAINIYIDYIKGETLATDLVESNKAEEEFSIDSEIVKIAIAKN